MNRVAIMVISWNNYSDVVACVESLLQQTLPDIKILVIDNDSKAETKESLNSYVRSLNNPQVEYIQSLDNNGTAGGFNHGVKWAVENSYDFIGSLNADAIADPDWVAALVEEINQNKDYGVATGLMLKRDHQTVDTAGEVFSIWGIPGPSYRDQPKNQAPTKSRAVFGATGGGFIARTDMYEQIGNYDEKFFMYFEDVDLCFRAQLTGWKVRYTHKALAYHKVGASSSTVPGLAVYNTFKNLPLLFTKNVPLRLWWKILPRFTLAYMLILGHAIVDGRGLAALKGFGKSILLAPHAWRERRRIQSTAKVGADYISSIILHDIPPEQTGLRKFRKFFTGKP